MSRTIYKVKDLIEANHLVIGDGYRAKNVELSAIGIPFARISNINNGFHFEEADRFPEEDLYKVGDKISRPGDVVFTSKGTVGRFAFVRPVTPRFVYSPQLSYWRGLNPDVIDSRYLYYWLQSQEFLEQSAGVKGQTDMADYVSLKDQRLMKVTLPDIDIQRSIARILGALDDKIELNRKMNQTLEAMAQSLFKSWFVDFDPVIAKMEGHQPYGMDAATAALFPDKLVDSQIGPVPEGWDLGTTAELAEYVNGRNFTKNATGTGRVVIRIAELNSGLGNSTVYNDVHTDPIHVAYPDDILFAWSGSLDVYRWHGDEGLVNQHIFKVVCSTYPKWFVYYHLREAIGFFQGIASGKATTMGHIKRSHLSEVKLPLPSKPILDAASKMIEPVYTRVHRNEQESRQLAVVRDTLLPKLLSGELRVKEAEKNGARGHMTIPEQEMD